MMESIPKFKTREIPAQGLLVHRKGFGYVKVFCHTFKNEADRYYYIMYLPDLDGTMLLTRMEFKQIRAIHWGIECYHEFIPLILKM